MAQAQRPNSTVCFEDMELDLRAGELRQSGGRIVRLTEQPLQILTLLLKSPGAVVLREEIRNRLWPNDTIVEFEHSINAAMKRLRQALGESAENPRYIETLPRRGYRWKVPVQWVEAQLINARPTELEADSPILTPDGRGNLIGKKMSHYRVLAVLGGGGMGVVYKAEDLKLGRPVALKFLPEELASEPGALKRLEQEARAASALNHPNICTIYEIEEHDTQPFIVMEMLEGETLRDVIKRVNLDNASLEIPNLIDLAIQISEGLATAHQQGIIHRDIKPANIFVTSHGQVKILDFGLAKLARLASEEVDSGLDLIGDGDAGGKPRERGSKPIVECSLSMTGIAMGTAGYMSPEQVRGEKLDVRTDLFSFGLVLYEMATGHRAFQGESAPVLQNAILNQTPAFAPELNLKLPAKLKQIIMKALEKDRAARYQTAAEMRADLMIVKAGPPARHRWKALGIAAVVILTVIIGGGQYWRSYRKGRILEMNNIAHFDFADSSQSQVPTLRPLTSLEGNVTSPTFSPDGMQIAFGWDGKTNGVDWDLYVKKLGTDKPLRLTEHPASWLSAAWSPDGRNIVISRVAGEKDAGVYVIPATGGPERQLTSAHFGRWGGNEISWSPDGKHIAFTDHPPASPIGTELLFLLSLDTLERKPINTECKTAATPSFSPHGDLLAWVCVDTWSSVSLHLSRMSDGHTESLLQRVDGIHGIAWSEDGLRIVFSSPWNGDLWQTSLSRANYAEKLPFGHDATDVAVSPTGHRLAYVQGTKNVNIWRVNLSGSPPQARKLIVSSREQIAPNISPDGSKIAFASNRSGSFEVWVSGVDGSDAVQLTSYGIHGTGMPRWSPDGKRIAFDSRVGGEANIYIIDANGGVARKLSIDVRGNNLPSWSRDGRWIYFVNGEDARDPAIWKVSSEGGRAVRITETDATFPLESPDGQYVYFSHHRRLWRVRTDAFVGQEVEGMPELQFNGDTWVPTGSGIYFMADVNHQTELDYFDLNSKKVRRVFTLGKSLPGWSGGVSISSDGQWLLYPQLDGKSSDLMMIENWK